MLTRYGLERLLFCLSQERSSRQIGSEGRAALSGLDPLSSPSHAGSRPVWFWRTFARSLPRDGAQYLRHR